MKKAGGIVLFALYVCLTLYGIGRQHGRAEYLQLPAELKSHAAWASLKEAQTQSDRILLYARLGVLVPGFALFFWGLFGDKKKHRADTQ